MKAREVRVINALVMIPAAICICLGVFAGGCKKEKAPATVSDDMQPSPASESRPAMPAAVTNKAVVVDPKAVVVSVSGKTLTRGQLEEQLTRALASPQFQGMPPDMAPKARQKLEKDITEGFVVQTVLEQEADSRKIVVEDKDCDEEMTKMQSSLQGGMSMEQMVTMMGMDMKELKSQIAQELKIRKLLDLQTTNVPLPTAEEVLGFYSNTPAAFQMPTDYVHVRHILVALDNPESIAMPGAEPKPVDEAAKATKKKKAESLREELVKGADFAAVAKASSDCPSKAKGGDLGRLPRDKTVPEFEKAAFSQEINAIGPVVETQFGFHIIQVLGKGQAGQLPLKEVEAELSDYLLTDKRRQAVMGFVEKLKASAKVEYAK